MYRGRRMTFEEYQKLPEVNISKLLGLLVSPKEFLHRELNPPADTPAYRLGRLVHCATLEPLQLLKKFTVSIYPHFRSDEAKAWKEQEEASGRTVITEKQFKTAEAMQHAIWNHAMAKRHVMEGEPEATFVWKHARTGLGLKGRLDLLNGAIVDLKTAPDVIPRKFGRDAGKYHYHTRMSYYHDGVYAETGESLPVVLVVVQKKPPHDVVVFNIEKDELDQGRNVYENLIDRLQECRLTNYWPGIAEKDEIRLELPAWASIGSPGPDDEDTGTMFDHETMDPDEIEL